MVLNIDRWLLKIDYNLSFIVTYVPIYRLKYKYNDFKIITTLVKYRCLKMDYAYSI